MMYINFEHRTVRTPSYLSVRLRFNKDGREVSLRSQIRHKDFEVDKTFWKAFSKGTKFRDADQQNKQAQLQKSLTDLREHLTEEYNNAITIDRDWFLEAINSFLEPEGTKEIPSTLVAYFEYYLKHTSRGQNLKKNKASWQKWNTQLNHLADFERNTNKKLLLTDVDDTFLKDWIKYWKDRHYSPSTINKSFDYIKTVVLYANSHSNLEVHPSINNLSADLKEEKTPKVFLSFSELEKIDALTDLPDYLNNAKDWLIISCYTGQRVSDFMRFTSDMIKETDNTFFLEFKQRKTEKDMFIPILPEVQRILDKRNGEFPRRISDQRYNDYIKEVCRLAGIDEKMRGKIPQVLSDGKIRGVTDNYEKYKLVTSHIGRRSFATNYYGKVPTTYLKAITGHTTEKMLLHYIGERKKDIGLEAYEALIQADNF